MDELSKIQKLNEYLKELGKGELNLKELADPETVSLLKLADRLRENLIVSAPLEFRQQTKEMLLSSWQKRKLSYRWRLVKIIALAVAFFLLLSSLASATWKSEPGELLYPVKKVIQKAMARIAGEVKSSKKAQPKPPAKKETPAKPKRKEKKNKEKNERQENREKPKQKRQIPSPPKKGGAKTTPSGHSSTSFQAQTRNSAKTQERPAYTRPSSIQ